MLLRSRFVLTLHHLQPSLGQLHYLLGLSRLVFVHVVDAGGLRTHALDLSCRQALLLDFEAFHIVFFMEKMRRVTIPS